MIGFLEIADFLAVVEMHMDKCFFTCAATRICVIVSGGPAVPWRSAYHKMEDRNRLHVRIHLYSKVTQISVARFWHWPQSPSAASPSNDAMFSRNQGPCGHLFMACVKASVA